VVGDVQRTGPAEKVFLRRPQHDAERDAIIEGIVADNPDMLLLLGDQVYHGGRRECWRDFDRIIRPVIDADIPTWALMGNHDYAGKGQDRSRPINLFNQRFPHQRKRTHDLLRLGRIALLTLDSNLLKLSREEVQMQAQEYRTWLRQLDADPAVDAVIVASHHPPYTNGGYALMKGIDEMFAQPFLAAEKTRLYLSGHVHSYQRFDADGKMFIVSGGGGGPRYRLTLTRTRSPYPDQYNDTSRNWEVVRPFHYILFTIREHTIHGQVKMLDDDAGKLYVGDEFSVGS
jgi:DNA repair exonuclease SbcCD nuclease subunit